MMKRLAGSAPQKLRYLEPTLWAAVVLFLLGCYQQPDMTFVGGSGASVSKTDTQPSTQPVPEPPALTPDQPDPGPAANVKHYTVEVFGIAVAESP